jgi:hypothetical protein
MGLGPPLLDSPTSDLRRITTGQRKDKATSDVQRDLLESRPAVLLDQFLDGG